MRAFGRLIFFQKIHFLRVQKNCLGCGYRDFLAENPAARCPRTLPPRPTAPWDPAPAATRWVSGASGTANKGKAVVDSSWPPQDVHNLPDFSWLLQDGSYFFGSAPLPGGLCCLYSSLWLLCLPLLCWHPPAGCRPANSQFPGAG